MESKFCVDDDRIPGDQGQVHHLRRRDNGPVKRVAMERQEMGFSNDVQIERGHVHTAASHKGCCPMPEWLAQFDSSMLGKD